MYLDPSKDNPYVGEKCQFCGDDDATAMWRGEGVDTFVCRGCAIDILPRLIADACFFPAAKMAEMSQMVPKIMAVFWEAVACNAFFKAK
jgi:hypothetical protein